MAVRRVVLQGSGAGACPASAWRRAGSVAAAAGLTAALSLPAPAAAQPDPSRTAPAAPGTPAPAADLVLPSGVVLDGPPPPAPPAVITRAGGQATMRAIPLASGLRVDGVLDEPVYDAVAPVSGFIQQLPDEGAPATERTDAWVMFDDETFYVAGRCWDTAPPDAWTATEMRRDAFNMLNNDLFGFLIDTFYDRRNALLFYANPAGGFVDQAITNEGNPNRDWNPVWDVQTGRFDGGWTIEMAVPFASLRYQPSRAQVWGIQIRRTVIRKNEWAYLTLIPISAAGFGGRGGVFRVSAAGTLVGLEAPAAGRRLDVKPYVIGASTAAPPAAAALDGDAGVDLKVGLTENLTADFTYNTDFAQVEVDEQQVNLTRFNLFFPEKREFFLEGRGIFEFARGGFRTARSLRQGSLQGGGDAPTIFYSRRIGLQAGQAVPILGGARITGKVGPFDVGGLGIRTAAAPDAGAEATGFTVLRVKRDLLRRSSVGGIMTYRSVLPGGAGANQVYGADALFSFFDSVNLLGYYARTRSAGAAAGREASYQARFDYGADRYGFELDHLLVGDRFDPGIGFRRRRNFRRTSVSGRFSPRPQSIDAVRQVVIETSLDYFLTADTGQLETRQAQAAVQVELENSDQIGIRVSDSYERLHEPFVPGAGAAVPAGGHAFTDLQVTYAPGPQRVLSGRVDVAAGGYFDGTRTSVDLSRGRVDVSPRLSVEPGVSFNWIDLPAGSFRSDLVRGRVNYTFSPRMFASGLLQYHAASRTFGANLRLRWEYSPGSELFVVYTEEQGPDPLRPARGASLRNRGLVVKVTRLFRH